jgi:hypothetical protein
MGLRDAFKSMRMKDPVDLDAQVVSVTDAPDGATHGSCVMNLVVQPTGMEGAVDRVHVRSGAGQEMAHPGTDAAGHRRSCRSR